MLKLSFSWGPWSKAQKKPRVNLARGNPRTDYLRQSRKQEPTQAKLRGTAIQELGCLLPSNQPLGKTSITHLFHREGSSSCRSTFISSNTFWAFTNSSSALITEKGDCRLQRRKISCRAGTTVTLDFFGRPGKILAWGIPHPKWVSQEPGLHHKWPDAPSACMCYSQAFSQWISLFGYSKSNSNIH